MEHHLGQLSAHLETDSVEAWVTQLGGQLGPVRFRLGDRWVEPYSVAPWHSESIGPDNPSMIRALRGDFFCFPFGGNETAFVQEKHPPHGDTANLEWSLMDGPDRVTGELVTRTRSGRVRKEIRAGEAALYVRHEVSGMSGPMCFGHHAMLKFRSQGLISVSSIARGQVFPGEFESPALGGYSSLQPGAMFERLNAVPMLDGGTADLTRYPAREGFEDLVMICADPSRRLAWTTLAFPEEGYLWFALKDPKVLASTVLWHSNGGRHYAPWSGRHWAVLGIEDVTAYFHYGLAESCEDNPVQRDGFSTCLELSPDLPLDVRYIMGVAEIPSGFAQVDRVEVERDRVVFVSGGEIATARVDVSHLLI